MSERVTPWARQQSRPASESVAARRVLGSREVAAGLISGGLVSLATLALQAGIDDQREAQGNRQEEIRFVRQMAVDGKIKNASFFEADLRGANLSGLDLTGAVFTNADLRRANLTRANLTDARLDGADLEAARLEDTTLDGALLERADLSRAVFKSTDLKGARLQSANMRGATWEYVAVDGADLQNANLSDAKILAVDFHNADLAGTNLSGASFEANWSIPDRPVPADLSEVQFFLTKASGTDFRGARLPDEIKSRVSWVTPVCYNIFTKWPGSYTPPKRKAYPRCESPRMGNEDPLAPYRKPMP